MSETSNTTGEASLVLHYTADLEGRGLTFHVFRGRVCVIAAEMGESLGYAEEGKKLVDSIRDKWGSEFEEGVSYAVLTGDDLREFKAILGDTRGPRVSSAARLMVLYEPGFDRVCLKTEKPIGVELRRKLADEILPKLRRGEAIPATAAPALVRADMPDAIAAFTAVIAPVLAAVVATNENVTKLLVAVQQSSAYNGVINPDQAAHLRSEIVKLADAWLERGWANKPNRKSAGMAILHEIFSFVGWGHVGEKIVYMPAHLYGRALARIDSLWREVRRHDPPRGPGPASAKKPATVTRIA